MTLTQLALCFLSVTMMNKIHNFASHGIFICFTHLYKKAPSDAWWTIRVGLLCWSKVTLLQNGGIGAVMHISIGLRA